MSKKDDILDADFYHSNFRSPQKLNVIELAWQAEVNKLQRISILIVVIIAIIAYVVGSIFFGYLFNSIVSILLIISILQIIRKFNKLILLKDHSYTISDSSIIHHFGENERVINFSDIIEVDMLEWGIEITGKPVNAHNRILMIPSMIERYDLVERVFFKLKMDLRS